MWRWVHLKRNNASDKKLGTPKINSAPQKSQNWHQRSHEGLKGEKLFANANYVSSKKCVRRGAGQGSCTQCSSRRPGGDSGNWGWRESRVRGLLAARGRGGMRQVGVKSSGTSAGRLTCDRDEELAAGLVVGRCVRAVAAGPRRPLGDGGHRLGARPLQPAPVGDAQHAKGLLQLALLQRRKHALSQQRWVACCRKLDFFIFRLWLFHRMRFLLFCTALHIYFGNILIPYGFLRFFCNRLMCLRTHLNFNSTIIFSLQLSCQNHRNESWNFWGIQKEN